LSDDDYCALKRAKWSVCMCWRENPETYATHIFKFQSFKFWVFGHLVVEDAGLNEWGGRGHINRAFNVHTLFRDKHECITV